MRREAIRGDFFPVFPVSGMTRSGGGGGSIVHCFEMTLIFAQPLADNTKLVLNSNSEARVLFSKTRRIVQLIHGEVLCDVASDADRPFTFDAAMFEVRTEKASFAVQQLQKKPPQLLVKEGIVDIASAYAAPASVPAHTKVVFLPGRKLLGVTLSAEQLNRELMWREGKIAFDDTPLSDAIATFERYGPVHIDLKDSRLLDLTVSGVFSSDDPEGFVRAVADLFDARTAPAGNGTTMGAKS